MAMKIENSGVKPVKKWNDSMNKALGRFGPRWTGKKCCKNTPVPHSPSNDDCANLGRTHCTCDRCF